jgi:hypothetical protein
VSRLRVRLLSAFGIVLLVAGVLFVSISVLRSLTQPSYIGIVGELPMSARLVEHETVRHGFDYSHLFEFSCSDQALRDTLVRRWTLQDLTGADEDPVSFVINDHPSWWPSSLSSAIRKYGRSDESSEEYWSVWQESETGPLYVEVGRW